MALLSRAEILAQACLYEDIPIPEWSASVRIKAPTLRDNMRLVDAHTVRAREVEDYEADQALPLVDRQGLPKVEYYNDVLLQLLFAIVDEDNKQVFDVADYDRLFDLSSTSVALMFAALTRLRKVAEPIEPESPDTLKKTSGQITKDASSTVSPSVSVKPSRNSKRAIRNR